MKFSRIIILTSCVFILFTGKNIGQDLSELYKRVNPAVVTLHVTTKVIMGTGNNKHSASVEGVGSGFMISEKRLVTAAHVVQTAETINVLFVNGEKIPGKILSIYKNADVALVELIFKPAHPVFLTMGNSDEMEIGNQVLVIGAPFGLEHSLSTGHISGKFGNNRKISNAFTSLEFFQTDASINHGNSGGPMFNMNGEVIGIVSYILSQSGGFEGLGFAATSNVAKSLLLDRKAFYLGTDGVVISGELAKVFNIPQSSAYLIEKVVFLSPGGLMGLQGGSYKATIEDLELILGGDFILAIDGIEFSVENLEAISDRFTSHQKGVEMPIKILRKGKVMTLKGIVD